MLQNIFSHRPPLYIPFDKAEFSALYVPCFSIREAVRLIKYQPFTVIFKMFPDSSLDLQPVCQQTARSPMSLLFSYLPPPSPSQHRTPPRLKGTITEDNARDWGQNDASQYIPPLDTHNLSMKPVTRKSVVSSLSYLSASILIQSPFFIISLAIDMDNSHSRFSQTRQNW